MLMFSYLSAGIYSGAGIFVFRPGDDFFLVFFAVLVLRELPQGRPSWTSLSRIASRALYCTRCAQLRNGLLFSPLLPMRMHALRGGGRRLHDVDPPRERADASVCDSIRDCDHSEQPTRRVQCSLGARAGESSGPLFGHLFPVCQQSHKRRGRRSRLHSAQ